MVSFFSLSIILGKKGFIYHIKVRYMAGFYTSIYSELDLLMITPQRKRNSFRLQTVDVEASIRLRLNGGLPLTIELCQFPMNSSQYMCIKVVIVTLLFCLWPCLALIGEFHVYSCHCFANLHE